MDADYFRLLFDYGWWARDRLLETAGGLSDEEWRKANGFTYGSIGGILQHTLGAERIWGSRIRGVAPAVPFGTPEALPSLDELVSSWQKEEATLRDWLPSLTDEMLPSMVATRTGEMPMWQAISQLTYHSMQHRSEAAEALTIAGFSPGNLDLMIYIQERGQ